MQSIDERVYDIPRSKPFVSSEELEEQLVEEGYDLEEMHGWLKV